MVRRRWRREEDRETEAPEATASPREASHARRSRRPRSDSRGESTWGRRLSIALLLMALVVLALPNLIAWTGLHQTLIDRGLSGFGFEGRILVKRATFGWFQPVVLEGIQATGRDGQSLLTADRITLASRLGALLWNHDPGLITIDQPVLHAVLRSDGSNFEDALQAWLQPSTQPPPAGSSSGDLPPLRLLVRNGQVQLVDGVTARTSLLEAVQLDLQTAQAACIETAFSCRAGGASGDAAGGELQLTAALDRGVRQLLLRDGDFELTATRFPLAALGPVLRRLAGDGTLDGLLTGAARGDWKAASGELALTFRQLTGQGIRFAGQRVLGNDTLVLERLLADGETRIGNEGLTARRLSVSSELGNVRAEGQLPWQQLARLVNNGQLTHAPFQMDGQLDLVRIGTMLPGLLRLHDDLTLESGELKFNVATRQQDGWPGLVANIDAIQLAARRQGRRIAWPQPLRLVTTATQRDGQLMIDDLLCETGFLNVRGKGNLAEARFEVEGDLDKACRQLEQFVDLGGWSLGGTLRGELSCRAESPLGPGAEAAQLTGRPIRIAADLNVQQAAITMPGTAPWSEPSLRLVTNATAQAQPDGALLVMQGIGQLFLGENRASFRLVQPVSNLFAPRSIEGEAALGGSTERWLALLRHFVEPGAFNLAGTGSLTASVQMTPASFVAQDLKYQFSQFGFDGFGMAIREDQVSGEGALEYDIPAARLTARNLTLVSSSVAALAERASLGFTPALNTGGSVALRGDIHRILGWFGLSQQTDPVQLFGGFEGTVALGNEGDFVEGTLNGLVTDLIAARPDFQAARWVELAREPRATIEGTIGISRDCSRLRFRRLQLAGRAVSAALEGTVRDIAGTFDMDLAGTWSPDWQQINGLVAAYSGDMVRLRGREAQQITIRGPLFALPGSGPAPFLPAATTVATEFKWDQGNVFLLPVGPAHLQARLTGSLAEVTTGEIPFGGGTLQASPRIDLAAAAPVVTFTPGYLMRNVQLTPEFCRDWLRFVAPLLADATTAEGRFSVRTGDVRIPLDNLPQATADGVVTLHQVTVGAGPLAQQLLETVESVRALLRPDAATKDRSVWMNLGEQEVPVAIRDGRVWHNGLRLQAKDLVVTTRGSVGLDQSLQMVATIPIHDDWLNGQRWLEGLRGQQLEIPIGGTVAQPLLDRRGIQQLVAQLAQRTAQAELNRVVGEQTRQLQQRAGQELQQLQQRLQDKLQDEIKDKAPGRVLQGLNNLFGPPPQPATPPATPGGG